jgi:hypothetical protein
MVKLLAVLEKVQLARGVVVPASGMDGLKFTVQPRLGGMMLRVSPWFMELGWDLME